MRGLNFLLVLFFMFTGNLEVFAQTVGDRKNVWNREGVTGDWGGLRNQLNDYGLHIEVNFMADVMGNVSGGIDRGSVFIENIDFRILANTEKILGWPGSNLLISTLQNNGNSISALTGDVQGVSNIEAVQTFRLFEVWLQQRFLGNKISLLGGLYDVNSEFDLMHSASLFIQSSQGMGGDFAGSGLVGPPTFPLAGLGGRVKFVPNRNIYVQAGLFDGAAGSSNNLKSADFTWNSAGGSLAIAELGLLTFGEETGNQQEQFSIRQSLSFIGREVSSNYRTKIAFGFWWYSKNYVSERFDTGNALSGISGSQNDKGLYILADWKWNLNPKKTYQQLSIFGRIGFAENEVSRFKSYGGGGITYKGLITSDPNGLLGFSIATVQDSKIFQRINTQIDDFETVLELTYLTEVTPWLNVQPDIQYVISPGTNPNRSDALVIGLRTDITL